MSLLWFLQSIENDDKGRYIFQERGQSMFDQISPDIRLIPSEHQMVSQ